MGALARACYGSAALSPTKQLGTRPKTRGLHQLVLREELMWREVVEREVRAADVHIVYGFTDPVCRAAMNECRRIGKPYVIWMESLQARSRWHWRRVAREWVYGPLVRDSAGVFAIGRQAAVDANALGASWNRIMPSLYAGPRWNGRDGVKELRVGYCGRLVGLKGLRTLAQAVGLLSARVGAVGVDVIGDGPDRYALDELRSAGADLRWHGAVSSQEIPARLSEVAVLVLPTLTRDGWGYVVNEAMAAGRPVVVSDRVGARELVVSGSNGFVFPAGDAGALATSIEGALALHRNPAALASSLIKTVAGFDPVVVTRYMLSALAELLAGHEAPEPPWHAAARGLGGNDEVSWWMERSMK